MSPPSPPRLRHRRWRRGRADQVQAPAAIDAPSAPLARAASLSGSWPAGSSDRERQALQAPQALRHSIGASAEVTHCCVLRPGLGGRWRAVANHRGARALGARRAWAASRAAAPTVITAASEGRGGSQRLVDPLHQLPRQGWAGSLRQAPVLGRRRVRSHSSFKVRRQDTNPCGAAVDEVKAPRYGTVCTSPLAARRSASPGTGL
jgi:hypothetical protein